MSSSSPYRTLMQALFGLLLLAAIVLGAVAASRAIALAATRQQLADDNAAIAAIHNDAVLTHRMFVIDNVDAVRALATPWTKFLAELTAKKPTDVSFGALSAFTADSITISATAPSLEKVAETFGSLSSSTQLSGVFIPSVTAGATARGGLAFPVQMSFIPSAATPVVPPAAAPAAPVAPAAPAAPAAR